MPHTRRWLPWAGMAVAPFVAFMLLREGVLSDSSFAAPTFHFFIVSLTSLVACFMAGLLVIAAGQLRDARVVFLSLAFLGIAGIFAVHGLTTPNQLFEGANPWVGFSARLSLLVGSVFFALSTLDRSRLLQRIVVRRQAFVTTCFLIGLAAYATIAFTDSASGGIAGAEPPAIAGVTVPVSAAGGSEYGGSEYGGSEYGSRADALPSASGTSQPAVAPAERFAFLQSDKLSWVTTIISLFLFCVMTVHYGRLYLRFPTPLLLSIALSSAFLMQAQLSMSFATNWRVSWWEYHVLMLASFVVVFVGLAMEYKQSGTLHGVVAGLLVRDTIDQLQRGYTDVIVALVNAVEAKDVYTRGHTQRVTELAIQVGEQLRLQNDRLGILAQAAMLHDIGKIGVPDAILNKPGALTDAEFDIIKEHPVRGHDIIKEVRSLQPALGGIRHHHERLDGAGYPDNLAGDAIPLDARIIAVADVFDALTSARSYRQAWTVSRALEAIRREAGHGFDPVCVNALERVMSRSDRMVGSIESDRAANSAAQSTNELHPSMAVQTIAD
ncbi:MAG: HD domain-containing phosphohydrolase [Thermomicrobiales bacterium]